MYYGRPYVRFFLLPISDWRHPRLQWKVLLLVPGATTLHFHFVFCYSRTQHYLNLHSLYWQFFLDFSTNEFFLHYRQTSYRSPVTTWKPFKKANSDTIGTREHTVLFPSSPNSSLNFYLQVSLAIWVTALSQTISHGSWLSLKYCQKDSCSSY